MLNNQFYKIFEYHKTKKQINKTYKPLLEIMWETKQYKILTSHHTRLNKVSLIPIDYQALWLVNNCHGKKYRTLKAAFSCKKNCGQYTFIRLILGIVR